MTQPQKPAVLGYKQLDPDNVKLVNHFKLFEEELLRVVDDMQERPSFDGRWAAVARTHFQEGFMALARAVFQPERVVGHVDMEQVQGGIFELMEARPKRDLTNGGVALLNGSISGSIDGTQINVAKLNIGEAVTTVSSFKDLYDGKTVVQINHGKSVTQHIQDEDGSTSTRVKVLK